MVQRRFADADRHLWSFDKRHPERGVERKPIRRLFQVPHLYTVRRRDGTRDTSTETRLSAIESRAALVLARVVADARAGHGTAFSLSDHHALVELFVAQHRRSPDHHRAALIRRAMTDFLAGRWAQWESLHGPVTEAERALLTNEQFMLEGARDVIARHAADPLGDASEAMLRRGYSVARITAPRRAFILGSSSFVRLRSRESGRQDLDHPKVEMWLPIAPDVALISYGTAGSSRFLEISDRPIRKINEENVLTSTVFASASRELVEALAQIARRAIKSQGPWEAA